MFVVLSLAIGRAVVVGVIAVGFGVWLDDWKREREALKAEVRIFVIIGGWGVR
jgi:hypothetical protein